MKYIEKQIGNRTVRIQQHDTLVCINCGDKGYINRCTRMSNDFHVEHFKAGCNHCESGKKFQKNEQNNSIKD